jgi:hypothetical protein
MAQLGLRFGNICGLGKLGAPRATVAAFGHETTLGAGMCAHGYIVRAVSAHMPENSGLIRCMLKDLFMEEPLRVHTTTCSDGGEKRWRCLV